MAYEITELVRVQINGVYRVLRPGQVIDDDSARAAGLLRDRPVAAVPPPPRHAKRPGPRDLDALTVAQLRQLAADRGVNVPSRARKSDLLDMLARPEPHKRRRM